MPESTSPGAVFLSYAREDADAARHIADALRGFGVTVWFDQNELRGGDAWDAKIRRQIKDCTLFVPIISANTQRRHEGYFRLEWHLAEQRSNLIARGRPFILPLATDNVTDAEALVPDAFLAVQWTRLPGGEVSAEFCERVRRLLRSEGPPQPASTPPAPSASPARTRGRAFPRWIWPATGAVLVAAGAAFFLLKPSRQSPRPSAANAEQAAPAAEVAPLIAKTRHILGEPDYGPAELAVAEKFAAQATDLAPNSAEAWALRGYVQATYILRTWDYSTQRMETAQKFCNQALALDSKQTEAMLGLAIVLNHQGAHDHVEALLRQAIQISPDDARLYRLLGIATCENGGVAEGVAILKDGVRRFPLDPLSWYDLGRGYILSNRLADSIDAYRHVVALVPLSGAYLALVRGYAYQGNLAAAEAAFAQVPLKDRTSDRAVGAAMFLALLEGDSARVIASSELTATDYFSDSGGYRGPKAFMCALAYEIAGKSASAREQWSAAEYVIRKRLQDEPGQKEPTDWDKGMLALTLAWKGDPADAAAIMNPLEELQREAFKPDLGMEVELARYYAALGNAAQAVPYIRRVYALGALEPMQLSPWYMKIRNAPEFKAFTAEVSRAPGPPT